MRGVGARPEAVAALAHAVDAVDFGPVAVVDTFIREASAVGDTPSFVNVLVSGKGVAAVAAASVAPAIEERLDGEDDVRVLIV